MMRALFASIVGWFLKDAKQISINVTTQTSWTGWTQMAIKDQKQLTEAQNIVFANQTYWPKGDETFCNLATQEILMRMGYTALSGMKADAMYNYVQSSKEWLVKPLAEAQVLVNEGVIMMAILPAFKLGQSHGHVNTLTPGTEDFSGHWNVKTPACMNLGRVGTCFRSKGINYAFVPIPEIYALVSTL